MEGKMNNWLYQYPFQPYSFPSAGKQWNLLQDLFRSDKIFVENIEKFNELVSKNINTLLEKKYIDMPKRPWGWEVNPVYAKISQDALVLIHDEKTDELLDFHAMNEQTVMYLAILQAVRDVGGTKYQQPFCYDKRELLGCVEILIVPDIEQFLENMNKLN